MCNTVKVSVKFDSKEFDSSTIQEKAEYVMKLKSAQKELDFALAQVKTIFEEDLNDNRNDITETIQIKTSLGVCELPSGYAEKRLKDAEVKAFCAALKTLDKTAYSKAVELVEKVDKTEINKIKKVLGPLKTLIDDTYKTEDPKPVVYTLNETI